jgi:hypothetical protein
MSIRKPLLGPSRSRRLCPLASREREPTITSSVRMMIFRRTVCVALIAFASGCKGKPEAAPPAEPKGATEAAAAKAPDAPVVPAPTPASGGAADAPASGATPAAICCCESWGDAAHFTLERDAAACARPEMGGTCVPLSECQLPDTVQRLDAGTTISGSWDERGLPGAVVWSPAEHHHVALEVKLAGKRATLRARAGEQWTKLGTLEVPPARGGTVSFTESGGYVVFQSTMRGDAMTRWQLSYRADEEKVSIKKN